ncbi:acetyl-CoA carboxylase biotin carboxyl carrier protein [Caldicellulosiruptoraceae bacterium PP1]
MDLKSIIDLLHEMSDSNLTSLEIIMPDFTIKMAKDGETKTSIVKTSQEEKYIEIVNTDTKKQTTQNEIDENLHLIKSPIVGTFYRSPAPGQKPFVQVGDKVKKGDILCIIEAMKLMNEIESDVDGEVAEILVENEQMVEYGQVLIKIRV